MFHVKLVLAKSTSLYFRLAAKTRFVPLLVLSPRDPLRWARAGSPLGEVRCVGCAVLAFSHITAS